MIMVVGARSCHLVPGYLELAAVYLEECSNLRIIVITATAKHKVISLLPEAYLGMMSLATINLLKFILG
jgi:hypothetical protein